MTVGYNFSDILFDFFVIDFKGLYQIYISSKFKCETYPFTWNIAGFVILSIWYHSNFRITAMKIQFENSDLDPA